MVHSVDHVTGALGDWLLASFPDVALALGSVTSAKDKPTIRVALADLYVEPSGNRLSPTVVLRLDYRIMVEADDPLVQHRYLGEIAFALAENPALAMPDADPVILQMERRTDEPLGLAVSTSLLRARTRTLAPPVLHAPVLHVDTMGTIEGVVESPDGLAIAGAVVELPALRLVQTTGLDGRFRFDAPGGVTRSLEVIARKQRFSKTVVAKPGQTLTLQLSLES